MSSRQNWLVPTPRRELGPLRVLARPPGLTGGHSTQDGGGQAVTRPHPTQQRLQPRRTAVKKAESAGSHGSAGGRLKHLQESGDRFSVRKCDQPKKPLFG